MKKLLFKFVRFTGAMILLLPVILQAQSRPFPQNIDYPFGYKPTNLPSDSVMAVYNTWKADYLKVCGPNELRVEFQDAGTTVSEGMGYGMLLTAYMGDKTEFDKLWNFVRKFWNGRNVMGWKVTCDNYVNDVGGSSAATDGDLDIAFALAVASVQWGNEYVGDAMAYINRLKVVFFEKCSETGRWCQKAGENHGGCNYGNTSYFMPGYYRTFYELTGDTFWLEVITDTYELLLTNRNAVTGFNSNEVDQYGQVPPARPDQNKVDYNGCRNPWRYVLDYLYFGEDSAKNLTDKLTSWANTEGIETVVDGYIPDGTPTGTWTQSNPWTGGWACGAMSYSQEAVNDFTAHFSSCNHNDGYYHTSLRALYMLTLTGNFWKPEFDADTATYFSVAPLKQNTAASADTLEVEIVSNESWEVQSIPGWITLSQSAGSGTDTVLVYVAENVIEEGRVDTLNFVSGSGLAYPVVVSQSKMVLITNAITIISAPDTAYPTTALVVKVQYSAAQDGLVQIDFFKDDIDNGERDWGEWKGNGGINVAAGDTGTVDITINTYGQNLLIGSHYFYSASVKAGGTDWANDQADLVVVAQPIPNTIAIVEAPDTVYPGMDIVVRVNYSATVASTIQADLFKDNDDDGERDWDFWIGNASIEVGAGASGTANLTIDIGSNTLEADNKYFVLAAVKVDSEDKATDYHDLVVVEEPVNELRQSFVGDSKLFVYTRDNNQVRIINNNGLEIKKSIVTDVTGRVLSTYTYNTVQDEYHLPISEKCGLVIVHFITDNDRYSIKLVK